MLLRDLFPDSHGMQKLTQFMAADPRMQNPRSNNRFHYSNPRNQEILHDFPTQNCTFSASFWVLLSHSRRSPAFVAKDRWMCEKNCPAMTSRHLVLQWVGRKLKNHIWIHLGYSGISSGIYSGIWMTTDLWTRNGIYPD